jgi:hypothetical protein
LLVVVALIIALVQVIAVANKPGLRPRFGRAIGATAVAGLVGILLLVLPPLGTYSKATADSLTGWIAFVALAWVWWNRMGRKRD